MPPELLRSFPRDDAFAARRLLLGVRQFLAAL